MNNKDFRILIVDDEEDIVELLSYNLKSEGYVVGTCQGGQEALDEYKEFNPDLIILDIMMPSIDGIEVCQTIRASSSNSDILIAFLTARSESFTQVAALDAGGDDYITKPIKPNVLKSKIRSILRRHPKSANQAEVDDLVFDTFRINLSKYSITMDGKEINLPKKEFDLLALLASDTGRVFKRQEILNRVWGTDVVVGDRTIDVHIRKLREKIGSKYIYTLKGVGYKFSID
jgi:two-component system alkaline phosphatase synthesis response regulator PhoP